MLRRVKSALASMLARGALAALQDPRIEQRVWEIVNAPRRLQRVPGNLTAELARRATQQTAEYVELNMTEVPAFDWRFELLQYALARADKGLYLEFGVEHGESINFIADHVPAVVHGFDSFEGLPEAWIDDAPRGCMSTGGKLPAVRSNVVLHPGWFEDILPMFVAEHRKEPLAFVHVDCDLYSSARTVFACLVEQIRSGTIILFDEYFNYPGWRQHEFKAFKEFVAQHEVRYRYIGYVRSGYSVAVSIQ